MELISEHHLYDDSLRNLALSTVIHD